MKSLFKIALRNLREHRTKSLIVGLLISFAVTLTFLGNAFFETSAQGVRRAYAENFTGDLVLAQRKFVDDTDRPGKTKELKFTLFGPEENAFSANPEPTPSLDRYEALFKTLDGYPEVAGKTGLVTGFGFFNFETKGKAFTILFGVEPGSYFSTFDNLNILKGRRIGPGETGILLSRKRVKQIEDQNKVALKVGDPVLIEAFGSDGLKVREVPLTGIYDYKVPTQALEVVSFVDVDTLRYLNNMVIGTTTEVPVAPEDTNLLKSNLDEDSLFDDPQAGVTPVRPAAGLDVDHLLGPRDPAQRARADEGSWSFLLLRLKSGTDPQKFQARLSEDLDRAGYQVRVLDWRQAAGFIAGLTDVLQMIFNGAILVLALVSVIIIMNTLVISVMERIREIGTMRALGAQKSFVRSIFIAETLSLAGISGAVGIVLGSLFVGILGIVGVHTDNDIIQILIGGAHVYPSISWTQILMALGLTLGIGALSWIYPVSVALKVSPLKALSTD